MVYDVVLVVGLVLAALSIPSIMSAWIDKRSPQIAVVLLCLAAVMVVAAVILSPNSYRIDRIPHVFIDVIGRYMR